MTSETKIAQGSRVRRQGRSRRKRRTRSAWSGGASVPDVVAVGTLARRSGRRLPDHELAPEVADLLAALVEGLGLDGHDAPVVLRLGRRGFEDPRLGVDRVAVEGREAMQQRLDFEVGDARAAD